MTEEKEEKWVKIAMAVDETGYTIDAIRCKIRDGIWTFWQKKNNRIHIDLIGYKKWVKTPASDQPPSRALKSTSATKASFAAKGSSSSPLPLI